MHVRSALMSGLAAVVVVTAGSAALPGVGLAAPDVEVTDRAVTFQVRNQDRGGPLPGCPTDGKPYTVSGHITGPADELSGDGAKSAVLFAHGHGFTEELWRYQGAGGAYDTAGRLAELGHTSVTYDRLGYGASGLPVGTTSCYASEADVAAQLVDKLKSGDYEVAGESPARFSRVALAGHSQGALFGELSAARFRNVDAYLHFSFDTAVQPSLLTSFSENLLNCRTGPLPAGNEPGNPTGYGFRGADDAAFRKTNFVDIDPGVFRHFADIRPPDPCGFPNTANQTLTFNQAARATITVPTFTLFGQQDSNFFVPPAPQLQSLGFAGSKDKKLVVLPGAGHTPMLERTGAPAFRKAVSDWLTPRGF